MMKYNQSAYLKLFWIGLILSAVLRMEAMDFRVYSLNESIEDLHYEEERDVVSLTIFNDRLSRRYTYTGSSPLTLFKLVETEEGIVRVPQLTVDTPSAITLGLLLISKGAQGRLQGKWLDDSFEYTPLGHVRFHNLSNYPVALDFREEKPVFVAKHESYLRTIKPGRRAFPMLAATADVDGKWKLFSTMPIPWKDNRRTLIFIRNAQSEETREIAPVEMQIFQDNLRPRIKEESQ